MKIWLPYVESGSGTGTFTRTLAKGFEKQGVDVVMKSYPHFFQYIPWFLNFLPMPEGVDIILTNTWNGFAFKRKKAMLVAVEHLFVLDPLLKPYKSFAQSVFHNTFIRYFEKRTQKKADKIVAVSEATAKIYNDVLGGEMPAVILNGIDSAFFTPLENNAQYTTKKEAFRLLFVGNFSQRKGADLLPEIMDKLGDGYELHYTSGLRLKDAPEIHPKMFPLGKLNQEEIREQYRKADLMIFPTRLEGLPLSVMEAMACGTPVISNDTSSLPEVISNDRNGKLCPINNTDCYVNSIIELNGNEEHFALMKANATKDADQYFSVHRMIGDYLKLFKSLLN